MGAEEQRAAVASTGLAAAGPEEAENSEAAVVARATLRYTGTDASPSKCHHPSTG